MKEISFRNDVLPLKNQLYRLALRITLDSAEAEDIVQETLIKVWNKREQWSEIESIEAFSLRICRNMALDAIKRRDHQNQSLDAGHDEHPDNASSPYEQTMMKNKMEVIKDLLNSLPEKQKTCMQLRDFEGKSYKEIATTLEISETQVKVNIYRARQTVKSKFNHFEKYGL